MPILLVKCKELKSDILEEMRLYTGLSETSVGTVSVMRY